MMPPSSAPQKPQVLAEYTWSQGTQEVEAGEQEAQGRPR